MTRWRLDWPIPAGDRPGVGVLKTSPEDFRVDELWDDGGEVTAVIAGSGSATVPGAGEHLLLYLEKTGDNTAWVAHQLGEMAGCGEVGLGYCGLKDRHAVTRQWFSIQRPGLEKDDPWFIDQVAARWPVLAACRRSRKLRRGDHQGNRFMITLRQVEGDRVRIEQELAAIADRGCPNYYGSQRFGHDGGNLDRAVAMAQRPVGRQRRGKGKRSGGGRQGLYFSAARSWLFNEVLAERVLQGNWNQTLAGEPDPADPTGPLWGDGGTTASGEQAVMERSVVGRYPEMENVFADTRMAPERRPLALRPEDLSWKISDGSADLVRWPSAAPDRMNVASVEVSFTLAPGQYATTLLSTVFRLQDLDADDAGRAGD